MNAIFGLGIFAAIILVWFMPWFVARSRNHHNALPIFLVTLFLGWTGIGWLAALIWACTSPPPRA
jgi:cyanate permease